MLRMGQAYATGNGIEHNPVESLKWYTLAERELRARERDASDEQRQSDGEMITQVIKGKLELLRTMTDQQKEEASGLIRGWSWSSRSAEEEADKEDPFEGLITADSKITAVTVYSNRAKITRIAEVEVPAGKQTVVFKDMPALLVADSLRVSGESKAKVTFGAVSSKRVMLKDFAVPRERGLSAKIEKLEDEIALIGNEQRALQAQRKFLENIGDTASLRANEEIAEINLKPEQWIGASIAIHDSMAALLRKSLESDWRIRELRQEIDRLRGENRQSKTGQRSILAVIIPLETDKKARLTIELNYQILNATWNPVYDARLSSKDKASLQLIQYGVVHQATGEDWKDVVLTLSTAQPQRSTSLPDLRTMWLDAYERRSEEYITSRMSIGGGRSLKATPSGGTEDEAYRRAVEEENRRQAMEAARRGASAIPVPIGKAMEETLSVPPSMTQQAANPLQEWRQKAEARRLSLEETPQQAQFRPAAIETGGFVSEYGIPGPATVPSDGTEARLMVGTFDTESKIRIHVKPQVSADAFLVAEIRLKGDAPILPGQVNLFRDDAYAGQSKIALLRPGEDYNLYFGVDDQVAVKRKTLKDTSKEEGLITRDSIIERVFVTELQNLHAAPVEIVLEETMPVPRNEKIKVEVAKNATTPGYRADVRNTKGLLGWEFALEPKEKKELKLGWSVNWPKDHSLTGL